MEHQKTTSADPCFTFTSELARAVKHIEEKDGIEPELSHHPALSEATLEGTLTNLESNLVTHYETRDLMIFAFVAWNTDLMSVITCYCFSKANGDNQKRQLPVFKGRVTAIEFTHPFETSKPNEDPRYEVKLVMGTEDGFVKIIDFSNRAQIQSFQVDTKAIVNIQVPPPESFCNHPICFVLLQDFSIYTISLRLNAAVAHFRPTLMMCDCSLSLTLHQSMKYLLQTTQGGYLVLWRINENLFSKLQTMNQTGKPAQKVYNVFPTSIMHSASIEGIKWASFLGDFLALITTSGVFKIIALNIDEKEEFATILEYQITNGSTVKAARLLPKEECLLVVRNDGSYGSVLECIFYSPDLTVTNLFRVKVPRMPYFNDLILSTNLRIIFFRSGSQFFITYNTMVEKRVAENKRHNDEFRVLNY